MNRILALLTAFIIITAAVDAQTLGRQFINTPSRRMLPEARLHAWSDWPACQKAATEGVLHAVTNWQSQAVIKNVAINGSSATGGTIVAPLLHPYIQETMLKARIPVEVANAFATSVSNAWSMWVSSLKVQGEWYPAFACYPEPIAPPTPNIPMSLEALSGNTEQLSAARLKESITFALGDKARDPKALAVINGFADGFAARFAQYRSKTMITNVMGTGPVPAFAKPSGPK